MSAHLVVTTDSICMTGIGRYASVRACVCACIAAWHIVQT